MYVGDWLTILLEYQRLDKKLLPSLELFKIKALVACLGVMGENRVNEEVSDCHRRLCDAVRTGACADLGYAFGDRHARCEEKPRNALDAELIVKLALGKRADVEASPKGISIKGARIRGKLDFQGCTVPVPLCFEDCVFEDALDFQFAKLIRLELHNCRLCHPLKADGCTVEGDVLLFGTCSSAPVEFPAATVKGRLVLDRMQIDPGDPSVVDSASPAGEKERRGQSAYHAAFNGALIKVNNGIFFRNGFRALGVLDLHNARIRGNVEFIQAYVRSNADRLEYTAIDLANARVDGYVFFRKGCKIEGCIDLFSSSVELIDIEDSRVGPTHDQPTDKPSIDAEDIEVRGNVVIGSGAAISSGVNLKAGRIDGLLQFGTESPAAGAIRPPDPRLLGLFDLSHAKIGRWRIDFAEWRRNHDENGMKPKLNGCEYWDIAHIDEKTYADAKMLIGWLETGKDGHHEPQSTDFCGRIWHWLVGDQPAYFYPQPAEHLAAFLRRNGRRGDARKILIWQRKSAIKSAPWTKRGRWRLLARLWMAIRYVISWVFGHGYSLRWLSALSGALIVFFALVYQYAYDNDQLAISRELVYLDTQHEALRASGKNVVPCDGSALGCIPTFRDYKLTGDVDPKNQPIKWPPSEYSSFNALFYSLDVFLPIVNLHQEEAWLPKSDEIGKWAWVAMWAEIILGWILSTLIVGSLTGIMKKE